jgi:hypothetical protein
MTKFSLVWLLLFSTAVQVAANGYKTRPTKVLYDKMMSNKSTYPELVFVKTAGNFSAAGLQLTPADNLVKLNYYYSLAGRLIQYRVKFSGDALAVFSNGQGRF